MWRTVDHRRCRWGGVVVEQSFRLRQGTAGGRFVVRVLGSRSTDSDVASGRRFLSDFLVCPAAGRFSAP